MASERKLHRQKLAEAKRRKKEQASGAGTPTAAETSENARTAEEVAVMSDLIDELSDFEPTPPVDRVDGGGVRVNDVSRTEANDVDMQDAE